MLVIDGPNLSLRVAELLLWLVVAMFPARSKIEFAAGLTVTVSAPLAGEFRLIPVSYTHLTLPTNREV